MDDDETPDVNLPELQGIARELAALGDGDVPREIAQRLDARLVAERAATPLGVARRKRRRTLRVASIAAGLAAASVIAVLAISQLGGSPGTPSAKPPTASSLAPANPATDSAAGTTLTKSSAGAAACKKPKAKPPCRTKRCRLVRKKVKKARHRACLQARGGNAPTG